MIFNTEEEVVSSIIDAYYVKRDINKILDMVTDDITFIGTDEADFVQGKEELKLMLIKNIEEYPESLEVENSEARVVKLSENVSRVCVIARQVTSKDKLSAFLIRITACCVKDKRKGWLIESIHISVANKIKGMNTLEKELDENRRKQAILLSSIPGGIAIYRLKKNGRVVTDYVSEGLAKMCGYTQDEFLDYLRDDAMINVCKDNISRVINAVNNAISNDEPISAEYSIYSKSKEKIMIRLDANVMDDVQKENDDVAVIYAVHSKVSESMKKVYKEQEHYRMILDMTDIAYFEWDTENGYYSSERFADYELSRNGVDSIMGKVDPSSTVYPDDIEKVKEYLLNKANTDMHNSVVARMKMNDGTYQWTEIIGYVEKDALGEFKRLIGVMRNVNPEWEDQNRKLKEALEVAKKANLAKTDFLSRVSHDMRTPLNGILGVTTLLLDDVKDVRIRSDLMALEQSGKYLLNLINDTLDVSRIECGKLELKPVVCDGRTLFNNVVTLIKPNIKKKDINLIINANDLPFTNLFIDVGRLEQVIMNILGNAIKFTPNGGTIECSITNLEVENGVIIDEIIIKDSGIGMSKDFLPHLFEPFSQEHNTSTSSSQGTGLGMAITKNILDMMESTISVASEVGKGTTFTIKIRLPIATNEQIKECKNIEKSDSLGHSLEGCSILLCEDNELNASIATRILERKGIKVDCASNGQIGVKMFEKSIINGYDAILMDIRMPVMNGIDAAKKIRGLSRSDALNIPIIAMTANAFNSNIEETKDAGMDAHLSKPIDTHMLFSTLEKYISFKNVLIRPKILVVDDIKVNRIIVAESVNKYYDVVEAADGQQALTILNNENGIEAVITDIQMPNMDGIELIKNIRENSRFRHIAIVANTQYGDPEQEEQLIEIGADDFVYKPSSPKIIEMRLRNVLKGTI